MKKLLLAFGAVAILMVLATAAFLIWNAATATTKDDVERMLRENVPTGTPAEKALLFLDNEGIEQGGIYSAGASSRLVDAGVPLDTEVIGGIIRHTSYGFFAEGYISFWLILDDERRVVDYHLEDGYDGL